MTTEERELWARFRRDGDQKAREELICYYDPQVSFWINSFSKKVPWLREQKEDIRQLVYMGLMRAVDRFEPGRNTEFLAYARGWIWDAFWSSPEVRRGIPKEQSGHYRKILRAHDALMMELNRQPTINEIAAKTGLTPQQVKNATQAMAIGFPEPYDQIPELPDEQKAEKAVVEIKIDVETLLRNPIVDEKKRKILILYYWEGLQDHEIGAILNIAPNTVKQIRCRIVKKLAECTEEGGSNEA